MNYPIIIKKEITDFLEAQDFDKIYTNLSDDVEFSNRVEVWLKSDIFITIKTQVLSNVVTNIMLYRAGDEEAQDFCLHEKTRTFLDTFYADVRNRKISKVPVLRFYPIYWEQYCKVFGVQESHNKELVNAKNLLEVLKSLKTELRKKFHDIEVMLEFIIDDKIKSEIPFRRDAMLKDESECLYRSLGEKDAVGNYLFLDDSSHIRSVEYDIFKTWKNVNPMPALEETLKGFYTFFDPEFINKILEPITRVLSWTSIDSEMINHNCEPFMQWVKQKNPMYLKQDNEGLNFSFKATDSMKVDGFMDFSTSYIELKVGFCEFSASYEVNFFNPFLYETLDYSGGITHILELLSSIYKTFSQEIAELNLTTAFINIYSMWEQIYSSVKHLGEVVDKELLDSLESEHETDPLSPKVTDGLKRVDAFNTQKPKTIIEAKDTPFSAIVKMSGENSFAFSALDMLMRYPELVKPTKPFMEILMLDSLNLYGDELYYFLIVCCENSIKNFRLVSLNYSHGNVSRDAIHQMVETRESFLKHLNDEELKNFKDWSAFEDCYPKGEDASFLPRKEFRTWTELQPKSNKKGEVLSGTDF